MTAPQFDPETTLQAIARILCAELMDPHLFAGALRNCDCQRIADAIERRLVERHKTESGGEPAVVRLIGGNARRRRDIDDAIADAASLVEDLRELCLDLQDRQLWLDPDERDRMAVALDIRNYAARTHRLHEFLRDLREGRP